MGERESERVRIGSERMRIGSERVRIGRESEDQERERGGRKERVFVCLFLLKVISSHVG